MSRDQAMSRELLDQWLKTISTDMVLVAFCCPPNTTAAPTDCLRHCQLECLVSLYAEHCVLDNVMAHRANLPGFCTANRSQLAVSCVCLHVSAWNTCECVFCSG